MLLEINVSSYNGSGSTRQRVQVGRHKGLGRCLQFLGFVVGIGRGIPFGVGECQGRVRRVPLGDRERHIPGRSRICRVRVRLHSGGPRRARVRRSLVGRVHGNASIQFQGSQLGHQVTRQRT